jgi:hypothetical protein
VSTARAVWPMAPRAAAAPSPSSCASSPQLWPPAYPLLDLHQRIKEPKKSIPDSSYKTPGSQRIKEPLFAGVKASSAKPALPVAAAVTESSSALPGADDVGDAGGSAWWWRRFRSIKSGARFLSDSHGERGLTLGRFGGGADAEGEGDGDGDVEAGRLAAELRRVSTIASGSPEAWRGFLSSSPLVSSREEIFRLRIRTSEMDGFSFVWKFSFVIIIRFRSFLSW